MQYRKNYRDENSVDEEKLPPKLNDSRSETHSAIAIEQEQDQEHAQLPLTFHLSGGQFKGKSFFSFLNKIK